MSDLVPTSPYLYRVYDEDTGKTIYAGNNPMKTIQALYCGKHTGLEYLTTLHLTWLKRIMAVLERLN